VANENAIYKVQHIVKALSFFHAINGDEAQLIFRLIKFLIVLAVLGAIGVVGFAYLGDIAPEQREVTEPVTFDAR